MEKPTKPKNSILKLLPKAAMAVTFQNPPFSPSRDKRHEHQNKLRHHGGRGFSGPMISIIPDEARSKPKNTSFEAQEPTSPKVSCMGQIKHKKKIKKLAKRAVSLPKDLKPTTQPPPREVKKKESKLQKMFSGAKILRKSSGSLSNKPPLPERTPSLSQMKRFSSGRGALANFDWTSQIAPVDMIDRRGYHSDEEMRGSDEEDNREVIIPFSAPMSVGGGSDEEFALQPRKEINLWKRRTMAPPRPLELNINVG